MEKFSRLVKSSLVYSPKCRHYVIPTAAFHKVGHVFGVYEKESGFTSAAYSADQQVGGKISELLKYAGEIKEGKCKVLYGVSDSHSVVAAVGLGKENYTSDLIEERDEKREAIRTAVAAGCRALKESGVEHIVVDPCGDAEAAAEGAHLSLFTYQDLKSKKMPVPHASCLKENEEWSRGTILASSQNIARRLMEMPANILTPTNFAQEAVSYLEPLGIEVAVRTKEWAKERNMNAFLGVSKGSSEPPVFLELTYMGTNPNDSNPQLALVGKGVTFDSGGISLKPPGKMEEMRADMGGAACTLASLHAIASLKIPINVKGFIPLCENMPSGSAIKPGDVVVASNGKTVQVDNTDAEGRLILADALHYASQHHPKVIINMATLTGAITIALGHCAAGAFTNSTALWKLAQEAGFYTGDRVWRMPLWKAFSSQVTNFGYADIHNLGKYQRNGGASLAASFLQQFVKCNHWMHLDIAGVMDNADQVPYLGKGMSGRPTRTVTEMASKFAEGKTGI